MNVSLYHSSCRPCSILATRLVGGTVQCRQGLVRSSRRLQDGIFGPSVPLRVLESTAIAASRREVPVAKVTVVG